MLIQIAMKGKRAVALLKEKEITLQSVIDALRAGREACNALRWRDSEKTLNDLLNVIETLRDE